VVNRVVQRKIRCSGISPRCRSEDRYHSLTTHSAQLRFSYTDIAPIVPSISIGASLLLSREVSRLAEAGGKT